MIRFDRLGLGHFIRVLAIGAALGVLAPIQVGAQSRGLPDFTELVEQVGPSVVQYPNH
jgi:hypothetical protein